MVKGPSWTMITPVLLRPLFSTTFSHCSQLLHNFRGRAQILSESYRGDPVLAYRGMGSAAGAGSRKRQPGPNLTGCGASGYGKAAQKTGTFLYSSRWIHLLKCYQSELRK